MVELIDHPYHGHEAVASLAFGIGTVHDARMLRGSSQVLRDRQRATSRAPGRARRDRRTPSGFPRRRRRSSPRSLRSFFEPLRGRGSRSRRPIFIVGMPRSGTTLTEQILASHPRVFARESLMMSTAWSLSSPLRLAAPPTR